MLEYFKEINFRSASLQEETGSDRNGDERSGSVIMATWSKDQINNSTRGE
jgi:hypothetical protein